MGSFFQTIFSTINAQNDDLCHRTTIRRKYNSKDSKSEISTTWSGRWGDGRKTEEEFDIDSSNMDIEDIADMDSYSNNNMSKGYNNTVIEQHMLSSISERG
ncbi:hypothetical protein DINM_001460 [Dirofilaria immitis]|nr:hypothetical protein [Dirofilaria immitis]